MRLPTGPSWLTALLQAIPLWVGLLLGQSVTLAADDLPADTNAITSLTPEQAAKLAAEFPGVKGKEAWDSDYATEWQTCLPLNGVTSLDPETATALAKYGKEALLLDGLTTLSPETAAALGRCRSEWLSLNGLKTLSPEAARGLAAFDGTVLSFDGLTTLSPESAAALATCKGFGFSFRGLADLTPDTAKALAGFVDKYFILGVTALPPETAAALGTCQSRVLMFPFLADLSPESARALAGFAGGKKCLVLNGLKRLPTESAAGLADIELHFLELDGLETLSPAAAAALSASKAENLNLYGLAELSPEAAASLVEFKGSLGCPQLQKMRARTAAEVTTLTRTDAALLAYGRNTVSFVSVPGITAFDTPDSVGIAEILAKAREPIVFPNLKRISPRTLAALVQQGNVLLPDLKTVEITPEPDGSNPTVADDFVLPGGFEKQQKTLRSQLKRPR